MADPVMIRVLHPFILGSRNRIVSHERPVKRYPFVKTKTGQYYGAFKDVPSTLVKAIGHRRELLRWQKESASDIFRELGYRSAKPN